MGYETQVETVARALYEHWVNGQIDVDYCSWEKLGDKQTWRDRATAAIEAIRHLPNLGLGAALLGNNLFQAAISAHNYLRYAQSFLANNEPGAPRRKGIMEDLAEAIDQALSDTKEKQQ